MRQHRRFLLLVAATVGIGGCADYSEVTTAPTTDTPSFSRAQAESGSITGRHLVVFRQNKVPARFAAAVEKLGGRVEVSLGQVGAATISGLDGNGVSALRKFRGVHIIEPEAVIELPDPIGSQPTMAADARPASPSDPGTALFFPLQWHLRAIHAERAWEAGHLGSSDVTVAILDTGIGYTHPDLQGLVDLDRSVSFVPEDDEFVAAFFPGAHPIADIGFHGTHVAATVSSNAFVAAGVTSQTTLMGVKVCSVVLGFCPLGAIFAGIEHAVENDADIINMSLGTGFDKKAAPGAVSVFNRLLNWVNQQGVTVAVSAGNDANDLDQEIILNPGEDLLDPGDDFYEHRPSYFSIFCNGSHVLCVSATGPTASEGDEGPWENVDAPAPYTNFGRSAISVAAPGGTSSGLVWAACSPFSLLLPICQTDAFALGIAGTSMASPHVAGLAALLVEEVGNKPSQIRAAIQQSADDLGQPGTDPFYGKGRINVASALGL